MAHTSKLPDVERKNTIGRLPAATNDRKHTNPRAAGRVRIGLVGSPSRSAFARSESELKNSETPIERPSASRDDVPITTTVRLLNDPAEEPATIAKDVITPSTAPNIEALSEDMFGFLKVSGKKE